MIKSPEISVLEESNVIKSSYVIPQGFVTLFFNAVVQILANLIPIFLTYPETSKVSGFDSSFFKSSLGSIIVFLFIISISFILSSNDLIEFS